MLNLNFRIIPTLKMAVPCSIVVLLLVSACVPVAATGQPSVSATPSVSIPITTAGQPLPTATPTPAPVITNTPVANSVTAAASQALAQLLGIDISKITVVSFDEVDWSDSCLGVLQKGIMCAQVIMPGYRIVLQAEGKTYEYHTDLNGSTMVLASKQLPEINLPVITYHREGGIAGFCDDVSVYANGSAKISSCKMNKAVQVTLSTTQMASINQWLNSFQGFDYQHKDPAIADAMTISLKFTGGGQNTASDADIQAILSFLSQIALQYNR